jgi:TolA-binding protein
MSSTRTGGGIVNVTRSSGIRKKYPLDLADKQLELAYGLCEAVAYQVLRLGDCGTELDGVEEKLKMLLEMTNNEVKRLEEEMNQQEEEAKAQSESMKEDAPAKPPLTLTAVRLARIAALTASKPTTTGPGTIEVDDASSISAESIDISVFRSCP